MLVHGTAIAISGRGVLLTGASQSGKSDLALRALESGAALVADDLVCLHLAGGSLIVGHQGSGPPRLAVHGIGLIAPSQVSAAVPLSLCVELGSRQTALSLAPQLGQAGPWHGRYVPQITLSSFEASAIAKLHLALERFGF